jgi:hypothetical protein
VPSAAVTGDPKDVTVDMTRVRIASKSLVVHETATPSSSPPVVHMQGLDSKAGAVHVLDDPCGHLRHVLGAPPEQTVSRSGAKILNHSIYRTSKYLCAE